MSQLLNRERAHQLMDAAGLDAIVVASPVNVRYFSGVHAWLDPLLTERMVGVPGSHTLALRAYAVLPREGAPALVLNSGLAVNAFATWIEDVRLWGARVLDVAAPERLDAASRALLERINGARATALDALLDVLADRGLSGGRIGVELSDPRGAPAFAELPGALPGAWIGDCTALLGLLRMVKTPAELELLRRAAEIGEAAAAEAFATMRPGLPLAAATESFRAAVTASGAAFDHFAAGVGGLSLATLGDQRLGADDCLCVDFGCIYDGYFSDSAATIALAEPAPHVRERYDALLAAVEAGIALAAPGVRASALQARMAEVLAETPVVCDPPTGHGLGLEVRDWPVIVADRGARIADDCVERAADLPLEAGMAINLEISAFLPGTASVEVERTIVVTAEGNRDLVPQPRERMVRP